jgi:ubiquinone/menaquinone biosynthesis C-methylase UbiE
LTHPGDNSGSYEAFQAFLNSEFAPHSGLGVSALELGCGGGQVALMLAGRGYTTYGVDYSETAVRLAERNARQAGLAIAFSVGDCLSLDGFDDAAFDLAVDNHVLHCLIGVQDRMAFLRSAYRVLKPEGILFSETMSCEGKFDAEAVDADPSTRIARSHTRYWASRSELNGELETAGFLIFHQELRGPESLVGAHIITYAKRPV